MVNHVGTTGDGKDKLMELIGTKALEMRKDFFVLSLHPRCWHCETYILTPERYRCSVSREVGNKECVEQFLVLVLVLVLVSSCLQACDADLVACFQKLRVVLLFFVFICVSLFLFLSLSLQLQVHPVSRVLRQRSGVEQSVGSRSNQAIELSVG